MGQLPDSAVTLVETVEDVENLRTRECEDSTNENLQSSNPPIPQSSNPPIPQSSNLAYCTQTTLSVDDTADIIAALQAKFPPSKGPHKEDICYATTNRQEAVKAIAPHCDLVYVIGAPNSSNSNRLVEVAKHYGAKDAALIQRADDVDWSALAAQNLGLTAGASAPEILVDEVIEAARIHFTVTIEEIAITREDVEFKLPRVLRQAS